MEQYVATIGFFDGVHRGHQCLIEQVKALSGATCMRSMLVTFDRHPRQVLSSDYVPQLLSTFDEKQALLEASGVDRVRVLPFTTELSMLSAREFMEQVLAGQLGVKVLLMGYDHRFGHGGGTFDEYVEWGKACGIDIVRAKELIGEKVSSSRIRALMAEGDVERANRLLGYIYIIEGEVVCGHQVGRTIGFPTANVCPQQDKMLPRCGVYAVSVVLEDGQRRGGMLCIGSRPTMQNGTDLSVEVNIFDFNGDLYGSHLRLELLSRLRDEVRFSSLDELQEQLQRDAAAARKYLSRNV